MLRGLYINTALLVIFTVILSCMTTRILTRYSKELKYRGALSTEDLMVRIYKLTHRDVVVGTSRFDSFRREIIEKSNIRRFLPFFGPRLLLAINIIIVLVLFKPVYDRILFIPSTLIVCALMSLLPYVLLDLLARYNSVVIRRSLAEFVTILNRWCAVKEDIFYAFEKSLESGTLTEPLKTFISEMLIQVKNGIEPEQALRILQLKVDNPQFKDFIVNIRYCVINRADIRKLLSNMEEQFYKIEEEYNRRKISTYRDRVMIYIVMFSIIFIAYFFLRLNPDIEYFYLQTLNGKMLLTVFCVLFALGFYVTAGITRYRY